MNTTADLTEAVVNTIFTNIRRAGLKDMSPSLNIVVANNVPDIRVERIRCTYERVLQLKHLLLTLQNIIGQYKQTFADMLNRVFLGSNQVAGESFDVTQLTPAETVLNARFYSFLVESFSFQWVPLMDQYSANHNGYDFLLSVYSKVSPDTIPFRVQVLELMNRRFPNLASPALEIEQTRMLNFALNSVGDNGDNGNGNG